MVYKGAFYHFMWAGRSDWVGTVWIRTVDLVTSLTAAERVLFLPIIHSLFLSSSPSVSCLFPPASISLHCTFLFSLFALFHFVYPFYSLCCLVNLSVPSLFRLQVQCEVVEFEMNHIFPAFSTTARECGLQKEPLLFSCAGFGAKYRRVCPCRDFRKGQVALCQDCLWRISADLLDFPLFLKPWLMLT